MQSILYTTTHIGLGHLPPRLSRSFGCFASATTVDQKALALIPMGEVNSKSANLVRQALLGIGYHPHLLPKAPAVHIDRFTTTAEAHMAVMAFRAVAERNFRINDHDWPTYSLTGTSELRGFYAKIIHQWATMHYEAKTADQTSMSFQRGGYHTPPELKRKFFCYLLANMPWLAAQIYTRNLIRITPIIRKYEYWGILANKMDNLWRIPPASQFRSLSIRDLVNTALYWNNAAMESTIRAGVTLEIQVETEAVKPSKQPTLINEINLYPEHENWYKCSRRYNIVGVASIVGKQLPTPVDSLYTALLKQKTKWLKTIDLTAG